MTSTPGSGTNPIDFPDPPILDQPVTLQNGATYIWDGEKWRSYVSPSSADNLWRKNGGYLIPAENGKSLAIVNVDGDYNVELKAGGDVRSTKFIYGQKLKVEAIAIRDTLGEGTTLFAEIQEDGDATFKDLNLTGNFKIQNFPELPA